MGLSSSVAPLACLASSWASSSPPTDNSRCKHASGETLRCVEQRRTTSNSVELHHLSRIDCVTLHYIAYVVLRCITLYYVVLRCIALYCVALRCIALHQLAPNRVQFPEASRSGRPSQSHFGAVYTYMYMLDTLK